jgi:hypothetical protein
MAFRQAIRTQRRLPSAYKVILASADSHPFLANKGTFSYTMHLTGRHSCDRAELVSIGFPYSIESHA